MANNHITANNTDPIEWLKSLENPRIEADCLKIINMMKLETGEDAKMWGSAIIGFGQYCYNYESGRKGDWFEAGFSPRKQNISIYLMSGFDKFPELMNRLGNYKLGKSCLYIKKLSDVDEMVLQELLHESVKWMRKKN